MKTSIMFGLAISLAVVIVCACRADVQPQAGGQNQSKPEAASQPAQPELAAPAPPAAGANNSIAPEVNDLLDRVENSGKDLSAFTAKITYEKEDSLLNRREIRTGEIIYCVVPAAEAQNAQNAHGKKSFAVLFDSLIVGQRKSDAKKHYIFNGRWLAEIDHQNKQFIKRELVPPGKELDPLKLGEGPFPLPIGQPKAEVLARFDVAPIEVPRGGRLKDLQNVQGIALIPKPGTREAKDYSRVELFYDKATNLPVGINAIEAGNENRKTILLTEVQRNPTLDEAMLKKLDITEPDPRQWQIDVQAWKGV